MGCGSSSLKGGKGGQFNGGSESQTGSKQDKERSYAIDKQIDEDAKKLRRECKILLLGSGESGKSTIVKQMKLIYQNGYSRDEMMLFRLTIHKSKFLPLLSPHLDR
jgi:guanine nucleotide-binding protein subunit alpha